MVVVNSVCPMLPYIYIRCVRNVLPRLILKLVCSDLGMLSSQDAKFCFVHVRTRRSLLTSRDAYLHRTVF